MKGNTGYRNLFIFRMVAKHHHTSIHIQNVTGYMSVVHAASLVKWTFGPTFSLHPFLVHSKKKSIYSTESCKDDISSSMTVGHRTPHTSSKAEHILAQVSAAERG